MADTNYGIVREAGDNRPLSAAERRQVIEWPWPVIGLFAPKRWGGTTKRESLIPDGGSHSWTRTGPGEGDSNDD